MLYYVYGIVDSASLKRQSVKSLVYPKTKKIKKNKKDQGLTQISFKMIFHEILITPMKPLENKVVFIIVP